jgi:FkbM family methyltransferase
VRPGDAVLDVGANVGFYSLLASRLVGDGGRVFAFEPLPRNLFYLRRHLDLNGAGNVAVHAVAVAEATGSEFLDVQGDPSMASFSERGLAVPTVSLDQFFDAASAPPPSFVKIDVEGAESRVLRGAKRTLRVNHPTVLLSAHGWKQYAECRAILESEKYAMKLVRDGARDGNYLLLAD